MTREPVVQFRNVSLALGGRTILRSVNLTIETGETIVLLGRSGSGKTSLLKLINGLLLPTSGEVIVEDRATSRWDPVRLKRRIGYAIQEIGLFPHFDVARNVGLVPRLEGWPPERIASRVDELLRIFDLPPSEFAHRYPRQLSGGQKQRVGIARALAADPDLLLFDEPFGALDPVTRVEAQRQFKQLSGKFQKTTVFVTHDVREALLLADRIALMHSGQLELVATPGDFRRANSPEGLAFLGSLD
jgi:osmoprotectant transport system ATP-binding protein